MKNNRIIWGMVSLIVLITIAVSFGTMNSHSQQNNSKEQDKSPFGDLSKYPVAEFDAPESVNISEREERVAKGKRYDKSLLVIKNPAYGDIASIVSDGEPMPSAIPLVESNLIIVGEIQSSKASLSNDKTGVYSEYSVRVQNILKEDKQKNIQTGTIITADRTGGVVQYPNNQKMLYLNDWQDLPEVNNRYVLFLSKDDDQNPNYRILTGYQLKKGNVAALDHAPRFSGFNGMTETDFVKLVLGKK